MKQTIEIKFNIPNPDFKVSIRAVFGRPDQLIVVSKLMNEKSDLQVHDSISIEVAKKLPVKHYLLGAWNSSNFNMPALFTPIDDMKQIRELHQGDALLIHPKNDNALTEITPKFTALCQKIEQDRNFKPGITGDELMSLVLNEDGTAKVSTDKKAIAIFPVPVKPLSGDGEPIGTMYMVAVAEYTWVGRWLGSMQWHVNAYVILVNKQGEASIHYDFYAHNSDFSSPLKDRKLEDFLNQECLHPENVAVKTPEKNLFMEACQRIEQDNNFRKDFSPGDLMGLVRSEDGTSKVPTDKKAYAIVPIPVKPLSENGEAIGVMYIVGIARYGWAGKELGGFGSKWNLESKAILVTKDGEISIHETQNASLNNFANPLKDCKLDDFLGQECLHPEALNVEDEMIVLAPR